MPQLETFSDLSGLDRRLGSLFDASTAVDGRRPLSDQLWLDLLHGGRPGSVAVTATDRTDPRIGADRIDDQIIGYAQRSCGNDTVVVQLVVHPEHRDRLDSIGPALLRAAIEAAPPTGVTWWVHDPEPAHHRVAESLGWVAGRSLLQMRRSLPTDEPVTVTTRPFRPGLDDEAWLEVNNRAFARHGEQGGWDLAALRQRMSEDWFDPEGFLVHEENGTMLGFCWTKLHHELDPVEGEIYVIGVDPSAHGRGLGRQLTLAGLDSIARRGVTVAMLYVDADNTAAVRLYERLGFEVARTDIAFVRPLTPGVPA